MAILKTGTNVEFVQPTLKGQVVEAKIVNEEIQYLVDYTNDEGELHQRWFSESDISVIANA